MRHLEDDAVDAWDGDNRVRLRMSDDKGNDTAIDLQLTAQGWQIKPANN